MKLFTSKVVALAASLVASFSAFAAEDPEGLQEHLVVYSHNGHSVAYALAHKPTAVFSDTELCIDAQGMTANHPLSEIDYCAFEKRSLSSAEDVESGKISVVVTETEISVKGAQAGAPLTVTSLGGMTMCNASADASGSCRVSIAGLPNGVYAVSACGRNFKITL